MATVRKDLRFEPFGPLQGDQTTQRSEYQIYDPVAGTAGDTVEFQISASQAGMIDLSQTYLMSRVTIKQTTNWAGAAAVAAAPGDDTPATLTIAVLAVDADPAIAAPRPIRAWEEDESVGEGFADSMWSSVELYINGVNVSDSAPGLYPYASLFRNALTKPQSWANGGLIRYATARAGNQSAVHSAADPGVNEDSYIAGVGQMKAAIVSTTPAGFGADAMGYALSDKAYGLGATYGSNGGMNLGACAATCYDSPSLALLQSKVAVAERASLVAPRSEWITLPNLGIMRQTSFLPADLDIRLVFTKNKDAFCLHGGVQVLAAGPPIVYGYMKPEITWKTPGENTCRLFLKRVYPSPAVQEHVTKLSLERPFRYNTTMARVAKREIGKSTQIDLSDLLNGPRPDTVCVFFTSTLGVAGEVSRNPFCSTDVIQKSVAQKTMHDISGVNYGGQGDFVSSIYVTWGGRQFPMRPMLASSIDDSSESYAAYLAAFNGGHFGEDTPLISPAGFRAGRKFFCFQLNPAQTKAGTTEFDLSDRGSLSVHATIQRAVFTEDTTVIVTGFGNASVEIDSNRSIRKEGF